MKKRILAVIMAVCVSMTALPADVRAAEDSAVQTDLNFFMIYYVFPAILLTEHDDAKLIAELSADLGEAMVGINEQEIALLMAERGK